MIAIYQRLRETWLENGISINDGVALPAISRFEKKHALKLPTPFRSYLSTVNGMVEGETDGETISFLSLESIERELTARTCYSAGRVDLLFAEYLVFSHYYVLRAENYGTELGVYAADGTNEKQLAGSFEEFVSNYLTNPQSIALCW